MQRDGFNEVDRLKFRTYILIYFKMLNKIGTIIIKYKFNINFATFTIFCHKSTSSGNIQPHSLGLYEKYFKI